MVDFEREMVQFLWLPLASNAKVAECSVEVFAFYISNKYHIMDKKRKKESGDTTPFQDRVNVNVFFSGAQRRKLLDEIKKAIADGAAVMTVTGEEGTGKTMICRMVEKELSADSICVYLPNTLESFDDVVRVLALKVGTPHADKPESTKTLVAEIGQLLTEQDRRLVVLFDQSERMYLATIERIRKMLDRINADKVLLQIVFAGRKSLLENLEQLSICNFSDAEERHFVLNPLGLSETYAYLNHCAQQRSPSRAKNIFTPEAAKKIYSMAQGNLRMTNMLAAKSLEEAESGTSFMVLLDNVSAEKKIPSRLSGIRPLTSFLPGGLWTYGGLAFLVVVLLFFLMRGGERPAELELAEVHESDKVVGVTAPEQKSSETDTGPGGPGGLVEGTSSKQMSDPGSRQVEEEKADVPAGLVNTAAVQKTSVEGTEAEAENKPESSGTKETVEQPAIAGDGPEKQLPTEASPVESGRINLAPLSVEDKILEEEEAEAEVIASSLPRQETAEQQEIRAEPQQDIAEVEDDYINMETEGEPVILAEIKKRLPPPVTTEVDGAKKIVRIAPAQVKTAVLEANPERNSSIRQNSVAYNLFQQRAAAGSGWLTDQSEGAGYTIQLMVLTAERAEESLKRRLEQREYHEIADQLYILRENPATVFVFFGEYKDRDSAQQARNALPPFLRKHEPYVVSVQDAIAKVKAQ
jgi:type II secretory pathway predicted ATPase ExeA